MPKKAKEERALFIPQEQAEWVPFVEEGREDGPSRVEVLLRKNLSMEEAMTLELPPIPEGLEGDALLAAVEERNDALFEAVAPFILDWNMGFRTPSGEAVKADPPAVAGGKQIEKFLGIRFAGQIYWDLRRNNTGLVKAARSMPLERMADTSGDASTIPTGTEEA